MEITGKIIFVGAPMSGVSQRTGKSWMTQDYVVETEERYPRKCQFNVFGADRINSFHLSMGDLVRISFDIDAHEHNGRWYNEVSAWKVERPA